MVVAVLPRDDSYSAIKNIMVLSVDPTGFSCQHQELVDCLKVTFIKALRKFYEGQTKSSCSETILGDSN